MRPPPDICRPRSRRKRKPRARLRTYRSREGPQREQTCLNQAGAGLSAVPERPVLENAGQTPFPARRFRLKPELPPACELRQHRTEGRLAIPGSGNMPIAGMFPRPQKERISVQKNSLRHLAFYGRPLLSCAELLARFRPCLLLPLFIYPARFPDMPKNVLVIGGVALGPKEIGRASCRERV